MSEQERVDQIARAMRHAFNMHDDGRPPIPWEKANPEKQEAWRVCARAALATGLLTA